MIVNGIAQAFLRNHPLEAVNSMEIQNSTESAALLAEWPNDSVCIALEGMHATVAVEVLSKLPEGSRVPVIQAMDPRRAAALIRRLGPEVRDQMLAALPPDSRRTIRSILRYPQHAVGAQMDPNYPSLPEDISLTEALNRVRKSEDTEALYWFTVNRDQKLEGIVSVRDLLSSQPGLRVSDVARRSGQRLSALTDVEQILKSLDLTKINALPVVDEQGIYLGAIRRESVADLVSDERNEAESTHAAGSALGELYRLGLYGLVCSIEGSSWKKGRDSE